MVSNICTVPKTKDFVPAPMHITNTFPVSQDTSTGVGGIITKITLKQALSTGSTCQSYIWRPQPS
jgi:hypothetical protein